MKGDVGKKAGSAHVKFNEKNDGGRRAGSVQVNPTTGRTPAIRHREKQCERPRGRLS